MKSLHTSSLVLTLASLLLIINLPTVLHAQKRKPLKVNKGTESAPSPRPTIIPKSPNVPRATPTTGTLTIVAEPSATITLEFLNRRGRVGRALQATIEPGKKSFIFERLQPGRWRVRGEADGYTRDTKDWIVKRNKPDSVELTLTPIPYALNLKLNAAAGEIRYAKGDEAPRMVSFQDNRAQLTGLRPGKYKIEVKAEDDSYLRKETTIEVSGADNNVELTLDRRLSNREFSAGAASDWTLPGGWSFTSGKLIASGRGMALPRDQSFRFYKDFQLTANLTMVNGIAASFVVRAADENNYYLIQLTGAKASEPYKLRGFIVKNGVVQPFGLVYPISHIADTLKSGKFFELRLTMTENRITVAVEDSESAERWPLGFLEDPNRTFGIGALGVTARDGEKIEVGSFLVIPCLAAARCPNR